MRPHPLWRAADALMLLAFLFSIAVQFNDPDPIAWVAIYALASIGCVLGLAEQRRWLFPASVAAVAVAWSATLAPHVLGKVPFLDMFEAFEMKDLGVEESREMYGLLIIAAWMVVLALRMRLADSAGSAPDPDG